VEEKKADRWELRVAHEPDEEGVYWARVFVNGIWTRSFHSESRDDAIAAARRWVDWKQGRSDEEETIDLTVRPVSRKSVRVVFDLEAANAPLPLGLYARTEEDMVVWTAGSGREFRAPEDCVAVVTVAVPWRAEA